jgi:hypothetical protein
MKWQEVFPVIISMSVIILVAVLQRQSKLIAAVTATMPVTIPLALWIVYSSSQGERQPVEKFTQSLVFGIIPTVAFVVALWIAGRSGLKLVPMIALAYAVWAATLILVLSLRRLLSG